MLEGTNGADLEETAPTPFHLSRFWSSSSSSVSLPDRLRSSVPLVRPGSAVPVLQVLPAGQDQFQRRPGCSRGQTPAAQDGLQRQGDAAVLCPGDDSRIHPIITSISLNLFWISGWRFVQPQSVKKNKWIDLNHELINYVQEQMNKKPVIGWCKNWHVFQITLPNDWIISNTHFHLAKISIFHPILCLHVLLLTNVAVFQF